MNLNEKVLFNLKDSAYLTNKTPQYFRTFFYETKNIKYKFSESLLPFSNLNENDLNYLLDNEFLKIKYNNKKENIIIINYPVKKIKIKKNNYIDELTLKLFKDLNVPLENEWKKTSNLAIHINSCPDFITNKIKNGDLRGWFTNKGPSFLYPESYQKIKNKFMKKYCGKMYSPHELKKKLEIRKDDIFKILKQGFFKIKYNNEIIRQFDIKIYNTPHGQRIDENNFEKMKKLIIPKIQNWSSIQDILKLDKYKIGRNTLQREIKSGNLKAQKVFGKWYIHPKSKKHLNEIVNNTLTNCSKQLNISINELIKIDTIIPFIEQGFTHKKYIPSYFLNFLLKLKDANKLNYEFIHQSYKSKKNSNNLTINYNYNDPPSVSNIENKLNLKRDIKEKLKIEKNHPFIILEDNLEGIIESINDNDYNPTITVKFPKEVSQGHDTFTYKLRSKYKK